jgi:hypothetical protein
MIPNAFERLVPPLDQTSRCSLMERRQGVCDPVILLDKRATDPRMMRQPAHRENVDPIDLMHKVHARTSASRRADSTTASVKARCRRLRAISPQTTSIPFSLDALQRRTRCEDRRGGRRWCS